MTNKQDAGRVVELKRVAGYGFIDSRALATRLFFHVSDQSEPKDLLCEGDFVTFELAEENGQRRAKSVRRLRSIY